MKILFHTAIILSVVLTSCGASTDKQPESKNVAEPLTADLMLQLELADSAKLVHIKGLFYRGPHGHLYERTIADRQPNNDGPLVEVEYFNGNLPQDVDPMSFKALDGWYAKDKKSAYYYRPTSGGMLLVKLDKADAKSFKMIRNTYEYAVDKNHVYKDGGILENAKPETVKIVAGKDGSIISVR